MPSAGVAVAAVGVAMGFAAYTDADTEGVGWERSGLGTMHVCTIRWACATQVTLSRIKRWNAAKARAQSSGAHARAMQPRRCTYMHVRLDAYRGHMLSWQAAACAVLDTAIGEPRRWQRCVAAVLKAVNAVEGRQRPAHRLWPVGHDPHDCCSEPGCTGLRDGVRRSSTNGFGLPVLSGLVRAESDTAQGQQGPQLCMMTAVSSCISGLAARRVGLCRGW